jgi:hypothetical protein
MTEEYVAVGMLKVGKMKYASAGEVVVIKDKKERDHLLELGAIAVKPEEPVPEAEAQGSGEGEGGGAGTGKGASSEKDEPPAKDDPGKKGDSGKK